MRAVFAGMITACTVASAQAQERPIELATGPGRDAVEKYCGSICHHQAGQSRPGWDTRNIQHT